MRTSGDSDEMAAGESLPLHAAPEEVCRGLAERVEGRLDGMVDAMVGAIREKVAGYRALSGEELEAVRLGVAHTARLYLRTLAEGRDLSGEELAELEAIGEERSRQHLEREGLEAAVSAANAAGFDYLHTEMHALAAEWAPWRVDLWAVFRHLSLHAQEFRAAQWAAFDRGHRRPETVHAAEARGEFLSSLFAGAFDTEQAIEGAATEAGCTLRAPTALLVFATSGDGAPGLRRGLSELRLSLSDGLVSPMLTDPCPHALAVMPCNGRTWGELTEVVGEHLEAAGVVALAEPSARLSDLPDLYRGVRKRIVVMRRLPARPRLLRASDLTLMWAAAQADRDARFLDVDATFGPVLARRRDRAERDLEALTALRDHGGDIAGAARQLGVKVKEVRRKLREIERRAGFDLANPVDVARLGWALSLYWSDPGSLPEPGSSAWGRTARADAALAPRIITEEDEPPRHSGK